MSATKHDTAKPRPDLIAPELIDSLGRVLEFGARKYEPWEWAKGKEWARDYAAVLRHLNAWWGGEDLDPESGLSHLAHAACDMMFLIACEARQVGIDDRPRYGRASPPREWVRCELCSSRSARNVQHPRGQACQATLETGERA